MRKAVNLKIDKALTQEAKELNSNLSHEFEIHLARVIQQHRQASWRTENREALDAYNAHIEREGCFSDGLRRF